MSVSDLTDAGINWADLDVLSDTWDQLEWISMY